MKLFNRSKNEIDNEMISYDESELDNIEKLKNLLQKASHQKNEEQKEEQQKLFDNLKSLLEQIKAAKEEYEMVLAELMPVKWELLEKKTEISNLQSDYEALLSRIKQAKLELESLNSKINSREKSNSNKFDD
ncbi:MAG: hypothetical protein ACT4OW_01905 [Nitrososphaerota archaeon]